jgi:tetratricopeptide (TPR) repeat protein
MHYMEGVCYFWLGDLDAAEHSFTQSLQINPVFFWANYNLGLLYLKRGQINNALTFFIRAMRIPSDVTEKLLHDYQVFYTIWKNMPNPPDYIRNSLKLADQQIDYFLLVALAVKNNHAASIPFDPNKWNPVFF